MLENAGAGAAVGTQTDLLLNEPSGGTAATTFRNNAGATFDDQSTGSGLLIEDVGATGSAALVDNQGTWKKTGSAATSAISAAFNNSGTVDVESGTLDLSGGGTSSGTFKGAAGATVRRSAATRRPDLDLVGHPDRICHVRERHGDGRRQLRGHRDDKRHRRHRKLQFADRHHGRALAVWRDAERNGHGDGDGRDDPDWGRSDRRGDERSLQRKRADPGDGQGLSLNSSLTPVGCWRTRARARRSAPRTDLLLNEPSFRHSRHDVPQQRRGDVFDDQTTGSGLFIADEGSAALVDNHGTWKKTGSAATSAISAAFNNSGTVDVESGTLDLSGGGTSSGTFKGAAGATVAFGGTTTLTSTSSVSMDRMSRSRAARRRSPAARRSPGR